jgi:hypothetical protein
MSTPESRLDELFTDAFGANDAPMLDWVAIKFELTKLRAYAKVPTSTTLTLHIAGDREDAERIGALAAAQWPAVSGYAVSNQ